MTSVFPSKTKSHLESRIFFDGGVNIARYDKVKYPVFEGFTEKQLGFFWKPEEVDIFRDAKDYKTLSPQEQHIFTSNLYRQIVLDSVQGRAPVATFGPVVSIPEVETWLTNWQFSETIHSRSYTHIIRNIFSDPGKVFDKIYEIEELITCADEISKYYDELAFHNTLRDVYQNANFFKRFLNWVAGSPYSEYEHKKALWLALMAVNVLEGIRFYVSFACSWAFAETKRMEGNAKIIKLICRDENLHLGSTQQLIKLLPKDDPDFVKIREETHDECIQIFKSAVDQEIAWAKYLFKDGSMIGLNEALLAQYVYWIANRRLQAVGYPTQYDAGKTNPLPWTQKWIAGSDVQVAPQETEITSYTSGEVKQDLTPDFLRGLKL